MKDRDVVDAFVSYLNKHGHPDLKIDRRPDELNRKSKDIDAIAGIFAIEHTSIDTLPDQRRDSAYFMKAVGSLEQAFPNRPSFRLNVILEYGAVIKGQDWAAIRQALTSWIVNDVPGLTDGRHVIDDIPGIPFRLNVKKASDRRPGVFFSRFEPNDDTLPARIHDQFEEKAKKLTKYQRPGQTTILLVEGYDIALMNELKMLDAIRKAYPENPPVGVDQVWYADTSVPSELEFMEFTSDIWE